MKKAFAVAVLLALSTAGSAAEQTSVELCNEETTAHVSGIGASFAFRTGNQGQVFFVRVWPMPNEIGFDERSTKVRIEFPNYSGHEAHYEQSYSVEPKEAWGTICEVVPKVRKLLADNARDEARRTEQGQEFLDYLLELNK